MDYSKFINSKFDDIAEEYHNVCPEAEAYEYGDLAMLIFPNYNQLEKGTIGIIKERHSLIVNIEFPNLSCSVPYFHIVPLEVLCK